MRNRTLFSSFFAIVFYLLILLTLFKAAPVFKEMYEERGILLSDYHTFLLSKWIMSSILLGYTIVCAMAAILMKRNWFVFWGTLLVGDTLMLFLIHRVLYSNLFVHHWG